MSVVEPGEVFLDNLMVMCKQTARNSEICDLPVAKDFDNNVSQFLTCTINSVEVKDVFAIMPQDPAVKRQQSP